MAEQQSQAATKSESRPVRIKPLTPPSVDLRHCLEQASNEAIAKCAGE
jgi:hypothetical protein